MYAIIIVIIAIVAVFFLLKRNATVEPMGEASTSVTTNEISTMTTEKPASAGSELTMTTTKEGTGAVAKDGDLLAVHYTGYLADGTKFDSSVDRGTPFEFTLGTGMVIPGWDIGVKGMKVGEARKLVIPSKYAYGEKGFPGVIPENATLTFDVELIAIKEAAE